ncbi:MAG: hypothetical protein ABR927_02015 [Bacteroidales bacterium]
MHNPPYHSRNHDPHQGFMFDVSGTWTMGRFSEDPYNLLELYALTGQIVLWLMLIHALWATYVVTTCT